MLQSPPVPLVQCSSRYLGRHSALSFSLRSYRLSWPTVTVRQPESKGEPVRKKHATTMFVSRTLRDGLPLTKFRSFCCRSRSLAQTGISRWFGVGTFQSGGHQQLFPVTRTIGGEAYDYTPWAGEVKKHFSGQVNHFK